MKEPLPPDLLWKTTISKHQLVICSFVLHHYFHSTDFHLCKDKKQVCQQHLSCCAQLQCMLLYAYAQLNNLRITEMHKTKGLFPKAS